MISQLHPIEWIESQKHDMVDLLTEWVNINSGSTNLPGLALMLEALEKRFKTLKGHIEKLSLPQRTTLSAVGELIQLPHGKALRITKRPDAPIKIFLGGHMDTVYSTEHPFQSIHLIKDNILGGPGIADMKGGLVIMLKALEALEKHPQAENVGWEILINPDEEIGSIGSEALFKEAAKRNHLGLIFEPSFADGAIVSSRKGLVNLSVIARGKASHAGRDFDKGCNAILALSDFISRASQLNHSEKGISINPGHISGGGPINIVPDLAICRFNSRAIDPLDFENIPKNFQKLIEKNPIKGTSLTLHVEHARAPKIYDKKCDRLFEMLNTCAEEQGYSLFHRPSGGVCDGNILAEEGLPVIDTLGAIGGEIHTSDEYIYLSSLVQRSQLVALFLIKLATGELSATF